MGPGRSDSGCKRFPEGPPCTTGRSLIVPGCGTGYDVVAFAKAGYKRVVGVDMAPTSTAKAIEYAADKNVPNAHFETADFFTMSGQQFDVLYDYTFACAIEPSLRSSWAAQVAALVRPGGYALVQMYPLREECSGPPYSWTVTAYCALLEPNFELVFINECDGIERRKAFEKLSLWRRRTPTQSESI
ncbi:hypothetical protein BASA62_003939 [Batrachochytrium salamandrivorans]|nr:hypothetical protein BASA62_003939 [Batrachochytrium salamandrivorans]